MFIFIRPADLSQMEEFSKDAKPTSTNGPVTVHGLLGFKKDAPLARLPNAKQICIGIIINIQLLELDNDQYIFNHGARTGENFAHVLSWFLSAAFGVRIESLQCAGSFDFPFYSGYEIGDHPSHRGSYPLGIRMSSASCVNCSLESIASLTNKLLAKETWEKNETRQIERACMFYSESLRISSYEKNLSYTLLISALECLASAKSYTKESLIDQPDLDLLARIRTSPEFGEVAYKQIKARFFQLKRKCVMTVDHFLIEEIYSKVGRKDGFKFGNRFVAKANRAHGIRASYDLRSTFIHTGTDHSYVTTDWWRSDFSNVRSMVKQNVSNTCLQKSLNIYQLEGIVQHCISSAILSVVMNGEHLNNSETKYYHDF